MKDKKELEREILRKDNQRRNYGIYVKI